MKPLVSVIIPCFNQGRFLAEAIDSALCQTVGPIEIVVVDDGSTDNTSDVMTRYGDTILGVRQSNRGLAAARNVGIAASHGEFVAFLDSDDRWMPQKLERQLPLFADRRVGLVCGRYRIIDVAGVVLSDPGFTSPGSVHDLMRANRVGVLTAVTRRSVLDEVGHFFERVPGCEDWDLWIRIAARHALAGIPALTAEYRTHGRNMTGDPHLMFRSSMGVLKRSLTLHPHCAECRRALADGRRFIRHQYVERLRAMRRQSRQSGASLLSATWRTLPRDTGAIGTAVAASLRHHLRVGTRSIA